MDLPANEYLIMKNKGMVMKRHARGALALLVATALVGGPAWGNEREDLEVVRQTTINLIFALVEKGVLTQDAAQALVKQAEDAARKKVAATQGPNDKVVRVPYIPETVKREIRDQVKQEVVAQAKAEHWGDVNAVPEWVGRLHWAGDIRLRNQQDMYAKNNATPVNVDSWYGLPIGSTGNTIDSRDRLRLRARLGLTAKIGDMVSGGIRLATGSDNNPLSTNQTLGNTANKYSVWVDQAYLKLEPLQWLSILGGRMPSPWFSTNLVWHNDLTFEGVAANTTYRFDERRSAYLTAGVFPLQDIAPSTSNKALNKWLYGVQAGFDLAALSGSGAKFGLALYEYKHVEGIPNTVGSNGDYDNTAPQFRQHGNTMFFDPNALTPASTYKLASKFRELNLTGQLDIANFDPAHIILNADYVRNIGFNQAEIANRTGYMVDKQNTGFQFQVTVGQPKIVALGDWQAFIGYRRLQRDAVLDAFTDSDFHLGGTDTKGFFIGGSYGLDKNTWLNLRWMSADSISGVGVNGKPLGIDVLQMDLNAKF